jgi:uncharacterized protein
MKVCLDTNVLVRLFVPHPPFSAILESIVNGSVTVLVSNEILLEYEEVIVREFGAARWQRIASLLTVVSALHQTIVEVNPHFRFAVVTADADDNKFTDCAISGDADYILTYDAHFEALRASGYKPQPITPQDFVTRSAIG